MQSKVRATGPMWGIGVLACAALLAPHTTQAVTLVPNVWTSLPGTSLQDQPSLAGTVLADTSSSFGFTLYDWSGFNQGYEPAPVAVGTMSGSVQSRVVREDASGTLDFYWRVVTSPSSTSGGLVNSFDLSNFIASTYDANWRSDSLGSVSPGAAVLWGAPLSGALSYGFAAGPDFGLGGGQESFFFFLRTDATQYASSASYRVSGIFYASEVGGSSDWFNTFAPAAAIPEPATYALLVGGLLGVSLVGRRRAKTSV